MEKPHFGQTDNDKLQSKQEFEEKLESQHETTEPRARENEIDIRKVTTTENSEEHKQGSNLKECVFLKHRNTYLFYHLVTTGNFI